ncbi:hypothetical protein G5A97_13840 [[Clostridium] symbiosum]|jgi:hypothetical protein|nr:hypothetical protein [[Clostridium] symbiosum]
MNTTLLLYAVSLLKHPIFIYIPGEAGQPLPGVHSNGIQYFRDISTKAREQLMGYYVKGFARYNIFTSMP